ncbi:metal ABC transporter substrate-binding protein [bacterium]|nr:metal ABC transporter substrate-binding protein [bacterium]MCB2179011.1 metal ABC transporter substrate-binding protein [bacterium]
MIQRLYKYSLFVLSLTTIVLLAACAGNAASPDAANNVSETEEMHEHENEALSPIELPEITPLTLEEGQLPVVVTTTTIITDVVTQVGGENIQLTGLMSPGQDPHSFEMTPKDAVIIEQADLIFVNGLDLEESLMTTIEANATGTIVPVSAGITPLAMDGHADEEDGEEDHEHTGGDPHFWVDPNNAIVWTQNIADVLSAADPQHQETYQQNAANYIEQLQAMDAYIREQVATIPEENRKMVSDHQLFGYFADEYGFEVSGAVIPSLSSLAEPSAGDMASLIETINQEDVPAIFIGATATTSTQGLSASIAEEAGRPVQVITLLTGSLAPAGEEGDTYLDYLRTNIDRITSGLTP